MQNEIIQYRHSRQIQFLTAFKKESFVILNEVKDLCKLKEILRLWLRMTKIPFPIFAMQKWSGMTILGFIILLPSLAFATDNTHEHGGGIFHKFTLETDIAQDKQSIIDFDGWIGGDRDKLFLKSETEFTNGDTEKAEFWSLYSRNISEFWDMQIGLRQDIQPSSVTYFTFGFEGLAQYFFETQAHLFVSNEGHVSGRIRQENEFLLTQKIIFTPYLEANFYAQDVPENDVGAGLSDAEFGLQTRYEISRAFAPYIDLKYERKFGKTSSLAQVHQEEKENFITSFGLRIMF